MERIHDADGRRLVEQREGLKDPLFGEFITVGSNGLTVDPECRLVICTFANRTLDRLERNG